MIMMRVPLFGLMAIAAAAMLAPAQQASAGERDFRDHPKSSYYRGDRGPQVRGYSQRRGGYSYTYEDTVNTYGNPQYGISNIYRDPAIERLQSPAGPFDHGFFFDSANTRNGGNSPYLQ